MFVLQGGLYAVGSGLIVTALARAGRWRAAVGTATLALSPLLFGWQMVVLKDGQMDGAIIGAFGMVTYYRLRSRRIPAVVTTLVVLLLVYATLVRTNGIFATAPLAILLLPRPASIVSRVALILGTTVAVLAVSPLINHRLFGAEPSGIAKSQPIFDLAAIAIKASGSTPFTEAEAQQLANGHCVKAFFWDPLGDPTACGSVTERVKAQAEPALYVELARAAITHPMAYAEHRIRHWNSTERWLVSPGLNGAGPPDEDEPNDVDLTTPASGLVPVWQDLAGIEAGTPLGWPIAWTTLGLVLLPLAWRRRADPAGGLALALLVSALTLETSFLLISIASDLRYHLWPMTASPLALILLSNDLRLARRGWVVGAAALVFVIGGGVFARMTLPRAPDSYHAMVHSSLS